MSVKKLKTGNKFNFLFCFLVSKRDWILLTLELKGLQNAVDLPSGIEISRNYFSVKDTLNLNNSTSNPYYFNRLLYHCVTIHLHNLIDFIF